MMECDETIRSSFQVNHGKHGMIGLKTLAVVFVSSLYFFPGEFDSKKHYLNDKQVLHCGRHLLAARKIKFKIEIA